MHISFSRLLGETLTVDAPAGVDQVNLHLEAKFRSRDDLTQAKRNGTQVEMWTDLPVDGQKGTEWGPLPFSTAPQPQDASADAILLLSGSGEITTDELTLTLDVLVRLTTQTRFSYTYRLVHSSGRVTWLGNDWNNGHIHFQRADTRVTLSNGWKASPKRGRSVFLGIPSEDVSVATLNGELDWTIWALDAQGVLSQYFHAQPFEAVEAYFFPRSRGESDVSSPRPFAFRCRPSSDCELILTKKRELMLSSSAKAAPTVVFDADLASIGLDDEINWMSSDFLVLSSTSHSPASMALLPRRSRTEGAYNKLSVPLSQLTSLQPDASAFSIYSPSSSISRFIDLSDVPNPEDYAVNFLVGPSGGSCLLSPVYTTGPVSWQLSVMSPHQLLAPTAGVAASEASTDETGTSATEASAGTEASSPSSPSAPVLRIHPNSALAVRIAPRLHVYRIAMFVFSAFALMLRLIFERVMMPFSRTQRVQSVPGEKADERTGLIAEKPVPSRGELSAPSASQLLAKSQEHDNTLHIPVVLEKGTTALLAQRTGLNDGPGSPRVSVNAVPVPVTVKHLDGNTQWLEFYNPIAGGRLEILV